MQSYRAIARKCGSALHEMIQFRGYQNKHVRHTTAGDVQNRLGTVLALALSSERSASSTAAVLNENGVVVDHAILGQGGPVIKAEMETFLNNVGKLFENNQVDVVVMNAALLGQTRQLQKNISERLASLAVVAAVTCDVQNEKQLEVPEVVIIDDAVAQLRYARDNDVYYPHALQKYKLAIYCARFFQNPLSEVAALYNNPLDPDDCDLLRLELNPYQSVIPPSFLRRVLVMEICNELVSAGLVLQDTMAYLDGYGSHPSMT